MPTCDDTVIALITVIIKDEGILVRLVDYKGYFSIMAYNGHGKHSGGCRFLCPDGFACANRVSDNSFLTEAVDAGRGSISADPAPFMPANNFFAAGIVAISPGKPVQFRVALVDLTVWQHLGHTEEYKRKPLRIIVTEHANFLQLFFVDLLHRQKRFITKANNTVNAKGGKQIAKDTKERFDALHTHIRSQILGLVGGDVQAAYNCLTELVRQRSCSESSVWAILGELILLVIPGKPYCEEATA